MRNAKGPEPLRFRAFLSEPPIRSPVTDQTALPRFTPFEETPVAAVPAPEPVTPAPTPPDR